MSDSISVAQASLSRSSGRRMGLLTPRQVEVLQLVASGCSNREAGMALAISEQTVKNHLWHAMRRLAVTDRTSAVLEALRLGVVDLPLRPSTQGSAVSLAIGHDQVDQTPVPVDAPEPSKNTSVGS